MIIQATKHLWDRKMSILKTVEDRNKLMLRSGKERCREMHNFQTNEDYWRPCIGKFIIYGLTDNDDFKFNTPEEAIIKAEELINGL